MRVRWQCSGGPINWGAIRRTAIAALVALSLLTARSVSPAQAAEGRDEEQARPASEPQDAEDAAATRSAWYPPAKAEAVQQGGAGAVQMVDPGTVVKPEPAAVGPDEGPSVRPPSAEWVIAPIPFSNPTIDTGLILGLAYVFPIDKHDLHSPPSTVAVGGMYSSNGSRAVGGGARTYLNEDRQRIAGGIGAYDVRYDFFGTGNEAGDRGVSIPIRQRGEAFQIEYLHLWRNDIYIGGRYSFSESRTSLEFDGDPPFDVLPDELRSTTGAIGLRVQRDTRNSTFYPRDGVFLVAGVDFYDDIWGSDFTYQAYEIAYNRYQTLDEQAVLASRAYVRQTAGRAPFYALSLFGSHNDLRGYTAGQYRDSLMNALQTEYRRALAKGFGYVVFAGLGEVAPRLGELNFDGILPSVGVGLRYTIADENHINLRIDFAYGKSGGAVYFGAGEAY